ncbi:putative ubiquitin carboxy-terminal hydrolase [Gregarina niphandrodes]|uniref:ubiquitinyl hydrolase 1 n=1 Tax=Gregarina niphandrodes TaxID=110365 RepID=A0A023B451_GRENI|nr:putative ubiquitin carboxy-terminal hydrolase [Gregarina niphandrodes]EZG56363.1 putative ubiquitin carboxy-terminal hydrolase [Gregarina niphandrodes]|eukprot:XP_011131292.1 putative ubiquitin carboxy-terminal hydrolase [Gregarina niphandrodes]
MSWCLIESDPGVFWDVVTTLGCFSVDFQELWSLDEESLKGEECYGLIFLYKYDRELYQDEAGSVAMVEAPPSSLFFCHQMIENCCATLAVLSVVLNLDRVIDIGETLTSYRGFCEGLDPESRGIALANHDGIRAAHNVFGQKSHLIQEDTKGEDPKGDPFHFVALVPHRQSQTTWLLDGLRQQPLNLGRWATADGDSTKATKDPDGGQMTAWLRPAIKKIHEIIGALNQSGSEIKFNLIAVTPNKKIALEEQLGTLRQHLQQALAAQPPVPEQIQSTLNQINSVKHAVNKINERHQDWVYDNEIRKLAMTPLYLCALKHLGRRGLLRKTYDAAALR